MTNMIDASEKDMGPAQDTNQAMCLYIVFYLIVMSFFMINIFVGFVIVTFQEKGEKDKEGSILDRNKVCLKQIVFKTIRGLHYEPLLCFHIIMFSYYYVFMNLNSIIFSDHV